MANAEKSRDYSDPINHHSKKETSNQNRVESTTEVLYQKMGDRWFAFSLINDEIYVGSITQDEVDAPDSARITRKSILGNS